jgi:hypothetical protein
VRAEKCAAIIWINETGAADDEAKRAGRGDRRRARKVTERCADFKLFEGAPPKRASRPRVALDPDGSTVGRGGYVCTIAEIEHARRAIPHAIEVCMVPHGLGDDNCGLPPDPDYPRHASPQSRKMPDRRCAGGVDVEKERRIVRDDEAQSSWAANGHAVQGGGWLATYCTR